MGEYGAKEGGLTIAGVAGRFGVGIVGVVRWIKEVERKPQGRRRRKIALDALRRDVVLHPWDYQRERAKRFGVAQNAIFLALKKLKISYKKTLRHPRADEDARRAFMNKTARYEAESRTIVYIDESGFAHDMPRRHGYSFVGRRCYGVQDWHARGRTSVIGALAGKRLLTAGLFRDNVDADVFTGWVKQDLLPKLALASVIVMDNATFHKRPDTQAEILQAGHTIECLPPYSPDLNPIEHKWAQAKALRRNLSFSTQQIFESKLCG